MLLGQDFGRRHQRALPAGVDAAGGGQRRHHGLAGAHVALQQAVHGNVFFQVGLDFRAHPQLRGGQLKRQSFQQPHLQAGLRAAHRRAVQTGRPHGGPHAPRLQLRQLLRQQLLGLEPLPGRMAAVFQCLQRHIRRWVVQKL